MSLKIAILASGSGTNAEHIIRLCQAEKLDASVVLLISNNPQANALERARSLHIPVCALDHKSFRNRADFDRLMVEKLQDAGCELVVLAGYMRLLTAEFLNSFSNHVINIHPALLPSFPGVHGAADAISYGVKISGASVHFVEEQMDSGPLIIQGAIPVLSGEKPSDLQSRIHAVEYKIYPQAIQWIAKGRLRRDGRQISLKEDSTKKAVTVSDCLIWPPLEEIF